MSHLDLGGPKKCKPQLTTFLNETLRIRPCTARCCPAEKVNIYFIKKQCSVSKHYRTFMFQIQHMCFCFDQASNRFHFGKERSMIYLFMLGKFAGEDCLCLYSLWWEEKVLSLFCKAHLPSVRTERLNKCFRWLVYRALELQSGVTSSIHSALIKP